METLIIQPLFTHQYGDYDCAKQLEVFEFSKDEFATIEDVKASYHVEIDSEEEYATQFLF